MSTASQDIKKQKRAIYRALRASVSKEDKLSLDRMICDKICSLASFRFAGTVLLYSPIGSEIDLTPVAIRALELGKKIAFPICDTERRVMTFKYVSALDELKVGSYSIPEPDKDSPSFVGGQNALCIVPALAFDKGGYRLGYGGGYYDKFLKTFSGVSLGVAYDSLITDKLPRGVYDMPVSIILTERRNIVPNEKR